MRQVTGHELIQTSGAGASFYKDLGFYLENKGSSFLNGTKYEAATKTTAGEWKEQKSLTAERFFTVITYPFLATRGCEGAIICPAKPRPCLSRPSFSFPRARVHLKPLQERLAKRLPQIRHGGRAEPLGSVVVRPVIGCWNYVAELQGQANRCNISACHAGDWQLCQNSIMSHDWRKCESLSRAIAGARVAGLEVVENM
jgi:hypothetical protein